MSHAINSPLKCTCLALAWTLLACTVEPEAEIFVRLPDDEHPEGIDVAADGTLYVGIFNTGEIKAFDVDAKERHVAKVELGPDGCLPGLTLSSSGEVFVTVHDPDPNPAMGARDWVMRVDADGEIEMFVMFEESSFPNHITFDMDDNMYISESDPGRIFKVGSGHTPGDPPALWSDDGRLAAHAVMIHESMVLIGANGSALSDDERQLYVSNSSTDEILVIEIEDDGSAGDVTCFAGSAADCQVDVADELSGPDGLAFDVDANLYIASGKNDRLLRVSADGEVEVLWSGWPLAWPTVLTFGATPDTASTLYASNIDIARLYGTPSEPTSAIVGYDVGVEGR